MAWLDRWRDTWQTLGASRVDEAALRDLMARYAEPQRHYHTMQHLTECFAQWDIVRAEAEHPGEVELALWYHDAVYDARRSDNEARSAELAREAVAAAGLPAGAGADVADRVATLILETRHLAPPTSPDAACLVDVDLAILAAPAPRFDEYETQVRAEYAWVPAPLYRRKRCEVLSVLLARPHLYATPHFRRVAEGAARENLRRSLERLEGGTAVS